MEPPRVFIEYCVNCKSHAWCTNHNEDKYLQFCTSLKSAIQNEMMEVRIYENARFPKPRPFRDESLTQDSSSMTPQRSSQSREPVPITPRVGAFEVFVDDKQVFSKLKSGRWPRITQIVARVYDEIHGAPSDSREERATSLNQSGAKPTEIHTTSKKERPRRKVKKTKAKYRKKSRAHVGESRDRFDNDTGYSSKQSSKNYGRERPVSAKYRTRSPGKGSDQVGYSSEFGSPQSNNWKVNRDSIDSEAQEMVQLYFNLKHRSDERLKYVNYHLITFVEKFLEIHYLREDMPPEDVVEWDDTFIHYFPLDTVRELANVAQVFNIDPLLQLCVRREITDKDELEESYKYQQDDDGNHPGYGQEILESEKHDSRPQDTHSDSRGAAFKTDEETKEEEGEHPEIEKFESLGARKAKDQQRNRRDSADKGENHTTDQRKKSSDADTSEKKQSREDTDDYDDLYGNNPQNNLPEHRDLHLQEGKTAENVAKNEYSSDEGLYEHAQRDQKSAESENEYADERISDQGKYGYDEESDHDISYGGDNHHKDHESRGNEEEKEEERKPEEEIVEDDYVDDYDDDDGEPHEEVEEDEPEVTREYSLFLPLKKSMNKKITYVNEGAQEVNCMLKSSHPDFMQVRIPNVRILPSAQGKFQLKFLPVPEPEEKSYKLYVYDAEHGNRLHELILIHVCYEADQ